jgi:hypothetical protein
VISLMRKNFFGFGMACVRVVRCGSWCRIGGNGEYLYTHSMLPLDVNKPRTAYSNVFDYARERSRDVVLIDKVSFVSGVFKTFSVWPQA